MAASRRPAALVARHAALAIAGAALILQLGSCARDSTTAEAQSPGGRSGRGAEAPVPVTTALAAEKAVPIELTTIGTGEALSTVEVRAQVTGQLTAVLFAEGDDVTEGQLMFTIDARPFEVAVQQAEATLAKDQAQATNSEATRARYEDLFKRQLVSQSDFDASVSTAASAAATVQADKAALESAKLQLQYTKITAPVSGRTGALLVHQGSIVHSTDTTPLVVINQIAPIRITFAVAGQYLPQIRAGQAVAPLQAEAKLQGAKSGTAIGSVSFIDNAIDTTTGTIKLKATFPNTDHQLWPGELVEVRLRLSVDPHAVVVPARAVQNGQQGQFVFVVGADRAVDIRNVVVARMVGDEAVIGSGLQAGEEVVTDGQLRLIKGSHVTTKSGGAEKSGS